MKKITKIKLFESSRKHFALLGITPSQSHKKYPFFTAKILIANSWYWLSLVLLSVYIFREASDFQEYVELIFRILLPILVYICFKVIVLKMDKLFKFIDNCEKFVNKSK